MSFVVRATREFAWIEERTGCVLSRNARAIGVYDERSGRLVGMVAYDGWTRTAVFVHLALEHPIAWRVLLLPAFEYPFGECGKEVMIATVNSTNRRVLRLLVHSGFRLLHSIQDGVSRGEDLVFFEMRRRDCRFLRR